MIPKEVTCSTKSQFILARETTDRGKTKGTLLPPELHITNGTLLRTVNEARQVAQALIPAPGKKRKVNC